MSARNNQQRRGARRFKRMLRQTQHHQRGAFDVMMALAIVLVLCVVTSTIAGIVAINQSEHREDLWVDRCEHINGFAVQGVNHDIYCVKADALLVLK